jgi:hypothetical protein
MPHFTPSVLRLTSSPCGLFAEWPPRSATAVADRPEVPRDSFRPLGLPAPGAWPDETRNPASQPDVRPALTVWRGRPTTDSRQNDGLAGRLSGRRRRSDLPSSRAWMPKVWSRTRLPGEPRGLGPIRGRSEGGPQPDVPRASCRTRRQTLCRLAPRHSSRPSLRCPAWASAPPGTRAPTRHGAGVRSRS